MGNGGVERGVGLPLFMAAPVTGLACRWSYVQRATARAETYRMLASRAYCCSS